MIMLRPCLAKAAKEQANIEGVLRKGVRTCNTTIIQHVVK